MRIVVYHSGYGCDSGCCGHVVEMGNQERFRFTHPGGEDLQTFVKNLVSEAFGADHVADIDWDHVLVVDD